MAKFRKKPVVIEAIQWTGDNLEEVLNFTGKHPSWDKWFSCFKQYEAHVQDDGGLFKIMTNEGTMKASPGDWIIRGVHGEHYPCKPDIFAATYAAELDAQQQPAGGGQRECNCHEGHGASTCPIHTQADFDAQDQPTAANVPSGLPSLAPYPQALFDEFGDGADDRVMDYARAYGEQCRLAAGRAVVDGEMVERACLAYEVEMDGQVYGPEVPESAMRAALTAALRGKDGEA